jgi:hypothetical protein
VGLEVVDGHVDADAGAQRLEVLHQECGVERIGVVEVEKRALVVGEVRAVTVVAVVIDDRDRRRRQALGDLARDGRFSRAGAAGDANEEGPFQRRGL